MAHNFCSDALHVVERFTPVDANTIRYEATLDDRKVYTRPWKIALDIGRNRQPGYQFDRVRLRRGRNDQSKCS
jgi:hypothetical protein